VSVVVDANLVVAIILPLPYSEPSQRKMTEWKEAGEAIFAPVLWEYELTSALRRAVVTGLLSSDQARSALSRIMILNVQSVPPTATLHQEALKWAERLGQARAYDSQYLAVAHELVAALWTGDRRLANAARQLGIGWVNWIGQQ
jgi:predicted nucleic acid-binding protein